ncbi:MAG: hypothetical protein K0R98_991 [Rickettsiaceae bacterium]|jgi:hypothetical protein|nr:hypothetical protein [Rickettsiaceae bacterium]
MSAEKILYKDQVEKLKFLTDKLSEEELKHFIRDSIGSAAKLGSIGVLKFLIDKSRQIGFTHGLYTAFREAATNGQLASVQCLLNNMETTEKISAIKAEFGMIDSYTDENADYEPNNYRFFYYAAKNNYPKITELMLTHAIDLDLLQEPTPPLESNFDFNFAENKPIIITGRNIDLYKMLDTVSAERKREIFGSTNNDEIIAKFAAKKDSIIENANQRVNIVQDANFYKTLVDGTADRQFGRNDKADTENRGNAIVALHTLSGLLQDGEGRPGLVSDILMHNIIPIVLKDLDYKGNNAPKWADIILSKKCVALVDDTTGKPSPTKALGAVR